MFLYNLALIFMLISACEALFVSVQRRQWLAGNKKYAGDVDQLFAHIHRLGVILLVYFQAIIFGFAGIIMLLCSI